MSDVCPNSATATNGGGSGELNLLLVRDYSGCISLS